METTSIQDWMVTERMFADDTYLSDGHILITKKQISTYCFRNVDNFEEFKRLVSNIKTTDKNLLEKITYEKGLELKLPKSIHTRRSKRLYYKIDIDNRVIPFDYEKVRQVFDYTNSSYITIIKSTSINNQYLMKFFSSADEFCGLLSSCIPVDENEEYWED